MKLITFQHKSILETIGNNGIYKCDVVSNFHKDTPKCYRLLSKRLKIDNPPIFAWYNVMGLPLKLNLDTVNRAIEMVPICVKDYYLFTLDVPDEYVDLQNFYAFADLRCLEMEKSDKFKKAICHSFAFSETDETQSTIPYIKKEWVTGVYSMILGKKMVKVFDPVIFNIKYIEKMGYNIDAITEREFVSDIIPVLYFSK